MQLRNLFTTYALGFLLLGLYSCNSNTSEATQDNPTRGTIALSVDEAYKPVMDALTQAYRYKFPEAHFEIRYLPEQKAILELLQDSVRMAFVTRELTADEHKMLEQQKSVAKTHKVAIDGVALVVPINSSDTLIRLNELESVLKGNISTWNQLANAKKSSNIDIVVDDANSANLQYFKNRFSIDDFTKARIIVAGSNEKVVETVRVNPNAIGIIGVNWISDKKEASSVALSEGIKTMSVAYSDTSAYLKPFQGDLYEGYPLARQLYAISREAHAGLGGGLLTYIARDAGGLIIMKMGLVPNIPYVRNVELEASPK